MQNLSAEDQAKVQEAKDMALKATEEAFNSLDSDKNGTVDRDELLALMGANGGPGVDQGKIQEFFNTFDADGDGKVSKQEWLTFFGNMFDASMAQGMQNAE